MRPGREGSGRGEVEGRGEKRRGEERERTNEGREGMEGRQREGEREGKLGTKAEPPQQVTTQRGRSMAVNRLGCVRSLRLCRIAVDIYFGLAVPGNLERR